MNPEARYRRAQELGDVPTEDAARELIAMLDDTGEVMIDEGCSVYDVEPTYAHVASAARESLAKLARVVWPVFVEMLPGASPEVARVLRGLLRGLTPEERVALPPALLDDLAADAVSQREWTWERDFALRVRRREIATPEAFWRARLDGHPEEGERVRALGKLVEIAADKAALAREVFGWLEVGAPVGRMTAHQALQRLSLPDDVARALVPVFVAMLDYGAPDRWMPESELESRWWPVAVAGLAHVGPAHAAAVRPVLVERLLARNEMMSLLGSLRSRLLDALGDPQALLAEIEPRLQQLEASENVVERNRAAEIRRYSAGRIQR